MNHAPPPANERLQSIALGLLVLGLACPVSWHGVGLGLVGLALLAGQTLWRQRWQFGALPWVLAAFLVWTALAVRFGALREWLQWTVLLAGGWYAGQGWEEPTRKRFGKWLVLALGLNLFVGLWQSVWPSSCAWLVAALHGAPYALGGSGPDLAEEVVVGLQRSQLQYAALVCLALPFALRFRVLRWLVLIIAAWTVRPLPLVLLLLVLALPFGGKRRWLAWLVIGLCVAVRPGPSSLDWARPYWRADDGMQPKRLLIEYATACETIPKHLLGWGPGTYKESIQRARVEAELPKPEQNRVRRDGNGQYLVLAVETGVVGMALFLAYLLIALRRGRDDRELRGTLVAVLVLGACTGLLTQGLGPLVGLLLGMAGTKVGGRLRLLVQMGLVALALLLGLVWPARSAPVTETVDLPQTQERIWVEAEAAERIDPKWRIVPDAETGGHEALVLPAGIGKHVGSATYRLTSPAAGRWKLWLRVRWSGGCANSILASVNDAQPVSVEDAIFGRWHWVDVHPNHTFVLPAGEFTFTLGNSEDDVAIDQIAFLPDPKDIPLGIFQAIQAPPPQSLDERPPPQDTSFDKYAD